MDTNDAKRHIVEIVFAVAGSVAILALLFVKGLGLENFLDAAKDIAGYLVTIAVLFVAKNVYSKMTHGDFVARFEELIGEWAEKNSYLIDSTPPEERGQEGKRSYFMLVDPSNLVTAESLAKDANKGKGAFLYLPTRRQLENLTRGGEQPSKDGLTIEFRLNKGMFLTKRGSNEITDDDLPLIAAQFARRINEHYSCSLSTEAVIKKGNLNVIVLPLTDMPKSEETARVLVEVVDFVKSMVLALSRPSDNYMTLLRAASENK